MSSQLQWISAMEDLDGQKRLECFVGNLLKLLPYQAVKDAAVQATIDPQCPVDEPLRPAVAEIAYLLKTYQAGRKRASDYRFCGRVGHAEMRPSD